MKLWEIDGQGNKLNPVNTSLSIDYQSTSGKLMFKGDEKYDFSKMYELNIQGFGSKVVKLGDIMNDPEFDSAFRCEEDDVIEEEKYKVEFGAFYDRAINDFKERKGT